MTQARQLNLMREPATTGRVTNIELFFDLVYVFAVTQLSHYLLAHPSLTGALRTGLLLIMVWLLWVYTAWVTNWLDPERIAVRLLLLALAGASLGACTAAVIIAVAVLDNAWHADARPGGADPHDADPRRT